MNTKAVGYATMLQLLVPVIMSITAKSIQQECSETFLEGSESAMKDFLEFLEGNETFPNMPDELRDTLLKVMQTI